MVRTSPFAWAKRRNPKSSFQGRLLYQEPVDTFPKRTNNLVTFSDSSANKGSPALFAMSFQRKPTTDKVARSRPPTVKKVTWTPKLPLCPTGPWGKKNTKTIPSPYPCDRVRWDFGHFNTSTKWFWVVIHQWMESSSSPKTRKLLPVPRLRGSHHVDQTTSPPHLWYLGMISTQSNAVNLTWLWVQ